MCACFERVLCRVFSDYKVDNLRSAMDLENSFGPAYTRGMLHNGQRTWAVIGTGAAETPATIDGILTLGILWLAHCRQHTGGKSLCQGLKVIVPRGSASVTQARMACLHPKLGGWELYELCETTEELTRVDTSTKGNLKMRLVEAFDPQAAMARASAGLDRIMRLLPEGMKRVVEVRAFRPGEVALALHGLEFARVKQVSRENSFTREDAITFGAGANETALDDSSEAQFQEIAQQLFFAAPRPAVCATHSSACKPRAGSSRSYGRIRPASSPASNRRRFILRCRHSPPPTAECSTCSLRPKTAVWQYSN